MPDAKISQLPVASTPLAGTELVPVVQGVTTEQTTVAAILTGTVPSGTANGVMYLNGSKVSTTGSGLVFDGSHLGLGVTPSAWGGSIKALQVGGYGVLAQSSTAFNIGNNYYNNGTSSLYINSAAATLYQQLSGQHIFYTAPSGTAGNAISFTQAMTLDANGRWLLGTTTGVGSDFTSIRFNSGGTYSQGMNMVDSNASASGAVFQVFRKSDDTYLGNIRRNSTDNAIYVGGNSYLALGAGDTERVRITSGGDFIPIVQTAAPTLTTNQQMVFTLTSNTNLRISVRGTDGTTRVANITLA